jgi:hypothetical protein
MLFLCFCTLKVLFLKYIAAKRKLFKLNIAVYFMQTDALLKRGVENRVSFLYALYSHASMPFIGCGICGKKTTWPVA